jgi:hypothetical protein
MYLNLINKNKHVFVKVNKTKREINIPKRTNTNAVNKLIELVNNRIAIMPMIVPQT